MIEMQTVKNRLMHVCFVSSWKNSQAIIISDKIEGLMDVCYKSKVSKQLFGQT